MLWALLARIRATQKRALVRYTHVSLQGQFLYATRKRRRERGNKYSGKRSCGVRGWGEVRWKERTCQLPPQERQEKGETRSNWFLSKKRLRFQPIHISFSSLVIELSGNFFLRSRRRGPFLISFSCWHSPVSAQPYVIMISLLFFFQVMNFSSLPPKSFLPIVHGGILWFLGVSNLKHRPVSTPRVKLMLDGR